MKLQSTLSKIAAKIHQSIPMYLPSEISAVYTLALQNRKPISLPQQFGMKNTYSKSSFAQEVGKIRIGTTGNINKPKGVRLNKNL